ncbi:hypothetical protein LEN26_008704 [Aphanomyces euteiches]|nr:hypothetical protein AeMF1_002176 [Aphanomyces euteiches]KAH9130259.1 hypothetical protein LEN26_008704 [Aphanomyces euteiches]KAH9191890.1 hypothetical protein AeNC1_006136 [Aphanomyces euteiches]
METKTPPPQVDGAPSASVPKVRDIGTIALEAIGKIDTVLAFELTVMNDHMKTVEKENVILKAENDALKAKLLQQREDEADIYYYLHKKLDANYQVIAQLEGDIEAVKQERDAMDKMFHQQQEETQSAFAKEKKDLTERIESAQDTLHALEVFRERKVELEDTIAAMEATLAMEKENHKKQVLEMERRNVQEKERIKKDMLMKIKENKQNLLARTEDQLDSTTKRTMMENDQMISELQYQSKETEKLLAKYKALETEVVQLRLQLKLNKETEMEMAKRTHFYQKLIKKLNDRARSDAAREADDGRSKDQLNKANGEMLEVLESKSQSLQAQLRTLSEELHDTRTQLEAARTEKHNMLAQQDDTLRFLLTAITDITHQLALHDRHRPVTLKEWQAGDIIPAKLDDLPPSDVRKVLQMLFGKLHAYQSQIVETTRALPQKQHGTELPPIKPSQQQYQTQQHQSRADQIEILKALANYGPSTVPERPSRNPSTEQLHQRSVACQTLSNWSETKSNARKNVSNVVVHPQQARTLPQESPPKAPMTAEGRVEAAPSLISTRRPVVKKRIVLPEAHRLPPPGGKNP